MRPLQRQFLELLVAFLVLEEELEFELAVAGAFGDALGLEGLERFGDHTVGLGHFESQGVALGLVLHVDAHQNLIDLLGELLGLLLRDALVGELVVELIAKDAQVGEPDKEAGLEARGLLRLAHRLDELPLVQLPAGDGHDAVDLLDKMHRGGVVEVRTDLQQVVHIVAVESSECSHIGAVAFALLEFVQLQVFGVRVLQIGLFDELVVVEMGEEDGVHRIVEHQSEAALRGEVTELLVEHLFREGVFELVEIDLRVATLPGCHTSRCSAAGGRANSVWGGRCRISL